MVATSASKTNQPATSNRTGQAGRMKTGDFNFETVDNFSYLGSKITTDNNYDDEIRARLLSANRAYFSLQRLFRSKRLTIGSKLLLFSCIPRRLVFLARRIANSWPRSREESSEELLVPYMRMNDSVAYITTKSMSDTIHGCG